MIEDGSKLYPKQRCPLETMHLLFICYPDECNLVICNLYVFSFICSIAVGTPVTPPSTSPTMFLKDARKNTDHTFSL